MLAGQFSFDLYISILRKISFCLCRSFLCWSKESQGMTKPGMPILKGADKGPMGLEGRGGGCGVEREIKARTKERLGQREREQWLRRLNG